MNKKIKKHLLLEQLEDRIFLSATPLGVAVDPAEPEAPQEQQDPVEHDSLALATEAAPTDQPEQTVAVGTAEQTASGSSSTDSDTSDTYQEDNDLEGLVAPDTEQLAAPAGDLTDTEAGEDTQDASDANSLTGEGLPDTAQGDAAEPADNQSSELLSDNQSIEDNSQETGETENILAAEADNDAALPIDPMIGEDFNFTISFDNTTTSDVFGPYIDILLDGGQDGQDAATDDGITFVSADYLGVTVESTVINITQNEVDHGLVHPWARDNNGDALILHGINNQAFHVGDQFVSLRMPFGSFTPDQPAADVNVTAHMGVNADVDVDLGVNTTTGAMYGHDALNNPRQDEPLRDISTTTTAYKPEIISYHKTIIVQNVQDDCQEQHAGTDDTLYLAGQPQDDDHIFTQNGQEIPTGPNYPATYRATIDVADGQTVTGLQLTEHLPDNIYYLGDSTITVNGSTSGFTVTSSPGEGIHGGSDLIITLDNDVQGTANNDDVVITYDFYVPDILDHTTGDDGHIVNNGEVTYSWDPATNSQGDINDAAINNATINAEVNADGDFSPNPDVDDISHAQSITVQKDHTLTDTGATGYSPGDTLDYTIDFQISDYFAFGDQDTGDDDYSFRIDDIVADGLTLDNDGANYHASIDIWQSGNLTHLDLTSSTTPGDEMWVTVDADNNLLVHYNLQKIAEHMGFTDGVLLGDLIDGQQDGPTHGQITYSAVIAQDYHTEDNNNGGGDDRSVDQGDIIEGEVAITGDIYENGSFTGENEADESCDSFQITMGSVSKEIFAINGVAPAQADSPHISPGDSVTYLLHYNMPLSSTEDFHLTDYLPLPIFDADATGWNLDSTEYNGANGAPAVGYWAYTDQDTYHALSGVSNPVVSADGAQNALIFDWDPYHDDNDTDAVIEILFTVQASDEPFANGLFLTNQVRATEQGTPLSDNDSDAIVQVVLDEPDLNITKGVVQTDNDIADATTPTFSANSTVDGLFTEPGTAGFRSDGGTVISSDWLDSHDIDTTLTNVDAGDTVTMAIVVENTGRSGAFDVTISDVLPTGYSSATNIQITDGNGTALSYTGDLFAGGITLDDDGDGALDAYDATAGTNILVITYDLTLQDTVAPIQTLTNTAAITNFAGAEEATDHTSQDITDEALVVTTNIDIEKHLDSTEIDDATNALNEAVIGEIATYQVTLTIPEGTTSGAELVDTLDPGLTFLALTGVSASSGDLTTSIGDGVINTTNITASTSGQDIIVNFGDLTNSNSDNATAERITLTYTVFVNNTGGNQNGAGNPSGLPTALDNSAVVTFTGGQSNTVQADDITVIEPDLEVVKTVDVGGDGDAAGDAGDSVEYTITIQHSGTSETDAFDVTFADHIPDEITNLSMSAVDENNNDVSGLFTLSGNDLSLSSSVDMPESRVFTITVTGTLAASVTPSQSIVNTATAQWQSLDDNVPHDQDGTANERTGSGGVNDYTTDGTATITVDSVTVSKTLQATEINDTINDNSEVVIGEEATYEVVITVPEGQMDGALLVDTLDEGLAIQRIEAGYPSTTGDLTTDLTNGFSDVSYTVTGTGAAGDAQTVNFDLGNMTNGDDNNGSETLTIRYTVLVLNNYGNSDGQVLDNSAQFTANNGSSASNLSAAEVTVIEPWIETTKAVNQTTGVEEGDTLTYTVTLTNGGSATAYEVNFNDTLAQGTTFGDVQTADIDGTAVSLGNATATGGVVTFTDDDWDLDPGQVLTITYTVNVTSAALVDGNHTNTVDADWSSLDGSDPDERIYDETDGVDSPVDDGANANRDVATAVFAMDPVTIDKSDGGVTEATIGDIITYTLTINSPQGTIDNFVVEDVLAQGLVFNNDAVISTASGDFATEYSTDPTFTTNDGSADVTITWNLGDTVVNTDDPITIVYTATVVNVDSNTIGRTLGNTASIEYDNAEGNHQTPAPVTDNFTFVEPQITTSKDVSDPADPSVGVQPGETLTYTVVLENTGTSTAYEVTALDILPSGVRLDTGTNPTATYGDGSDATISLTDNGDGTLSFDSATPGEWDLAVNDTITITYTMEVVGAGYVVGTHTNTIDADWTNRDGDPDPNQGEFERVYDDGQTQSVHSVDGTQDTDPASFEVLSNPPALGDYIWFDQNGDGVQDGTEPGIDNVVVNLYADTDGDGDWDASPLATVVTSADGHYTFANLPLTTYTIPYKVEVDTSTLPGGMVQTWENTTYNSTTGYPDSDLNGVSIVEVLDNSDDITDVDFGYRGINSVGDTVWFDVDGNGVQGAGEEGINGLDVTLQADIDGDGIYEYTETQTTRTIGGVDGQYLFEYLPYSDMQNQPDFIVTVTPPAGSTATYDQDGGLDNTTSLDLDPADTHLTDDNKRDDIDFGLRGTGRIGDFVWYDTNGDGLQDEGASTGIGGVSVTLEGDFDGDGTIDYTVTTTTADDGSYLFDNLLGGTYSITVDDTTLPGGSGNWNQTYDRDEGSSSPVLDSTATDIALAGGQLRDDIDFGYTGNGSLGDTVWYDGNGNGVQESGELGLAGVTVTIAADLDGDGINEYAASTTTDADGHYSFDHLVGAEYTISVTAGLPGGATPTYDLDSATSSPDSTTTYSLASGESTDRVDFGYTGSGSIGDTVWNDINGDGIQDSGENGLAGVSITLTGDLDGDGQANDTMTTITDADGHYSFDNLFLGAYTVAVDPATLPPGNSQTHDLDDPRTSTPTTPNTAAVTLDAANPVNEDVDFGYNSRGTIGDTIWFDMDGNGIQDQGELGLAGVHVTLTGDVDGDGTQDTIVATTDANGHYLFDQLVAGDYVITVDPSTLPGGMRQTGDPDGTRDNTTALTLAGNETNLAQDFGYTGTGSIGDTIWNDANGDGTQNSGETGLAGVTVTLTADLNNDGVLDTISTTTDAAGNYHFNNLPADDYTISIDPTTLPPGMRPAADPDGGNDNTAALTLAGGEINNDQDFGYHQTGTIGDTIWFDANGDGIQNPGELGLANVTVTLTDANGVQTTVTTDADGHYLFDGLTAGDYTLSLSNLPGGLTQTADPDGIITPNITSLILADGEVNLAQDFGYTGTGSIGDTIWNDTNGDGTQNSGETGLAGVNVTLTGDLNGDGTFDTMTVTTDADGHYRFDHLPEGPYTITVDPASLPPGMQPTADPDGGNDNTTAVTLAAGENNLDQNFGYQQTGTVGDTIWFDANGNGVQDTGEPGLANVRVTLTGDLDGDGQADDILITTTDGTGRYLFDRLPDGNYTVHVDPATLPQAMIPSGDPDGGNDNMSSATIGNQGVNLDQDFGYKGTGSIGDTIWFDVDRNGAQDPGEVGIPGVRVTITGDFDNDGRIDDTMTTTTGPDGTYLFPNLPAGEYFIAVDPATLPGGMQQTADPDSVLNNLATVTLGGVNIMTDRSQDFGYAGSGSIGDQLWHDRNGNGVMDPGETPLPGVEVCIGVDFNGDGQPDYRATTTTGADGTYRFENLPAGTHAICVNPATLPPGIRVSFDPDGTGDNQTLVTLGPGEQNTSADFGYAYPPPQPVVSTPPHVPMVPYVPPTPAAGFGNDPLLSFQQFNEQIIEEVFFYPYTELSWPEPVLPVSPMYTGHAEPGTTLEFTLYDALGNQIGQETVMADTAGNWLASFPGVVLYDLPHHMNIEQTMSSYNASTAGFFNMRTYFSPNFSSMVFSATALDVDTVFAYLPSTIMHSLHTGNVTVCSIEWNNFNGYEFLAPSIQPAQNNH